MPTAITGARLFDGERVLGERTVVIDGARIVSVGGAAPAGAEVVDARGATLMPGLIDAHVHTSIGSLALALTFGVTTELEMQGRWTAEDREAVAERDDVADLRSAGFAITPSGGHPSELFPEDARPGHDGEVHDDSDRDDDGVVMPFSSTPEEAAAFVPRLVASGSDYIKF